MNTQHRAGQAFRALHAAKAGFIMPNAWDAGSAVILAAAGFPAIATTSGGIAFSLGKADYGVTEPGLAVDRSESFARIRDIVAAVPIPVSADLEAGYGDDPEVVAETIAMAIDAGLAGANIEDRIPAQPGLYEPSLAVERIAAARAMIDARGAPFVLTARTDALLSPADGIGAAVERLNRFREAGADCLYAPGSSIPELAALFLREVEGPQNFVAGLGGLRTTPAELLALGAQRVSLGASIARAALGFVARCAEELRTTGSLDFGDGQTPQSELNALFARYRVAARS